MRPQPAEGGHAKGLRVVGPGPCVLNRAPCVLDRAPCVLVRAPCVLNRAPCVLNRAPFVLNPATRPRRYHTDLGRALAERCGGRRCKRHNVAGAQARPALVHVGARERVEVGVVRARHLFPTFCVGRGRTEESPSAKSGCTARGRGRVRRYHPFSKGARGRAPAPSSWAFRPVPCVQSHAASRSDQPTANSRGQFVDFVHRTVMPLGSSRSTTPRRWFGVSGAGGPSALAEVTEAGGARERASATSTAEILPEARSVHTENSTAVCGLSCATAGPPHPTMLRLGWARAAGGLCGVPGPRRPGTR